MGLLDTLNHAMLDNSRLHFLEGARLSPDESWLVTLSAPLAAFNGSYVNALETRDDNAHLREGMMQMWDVKDRASFVTTVAWLVEKGHRDQYLPLWKGMQKMSEVRRKANPLMRILAGAIVEIQAHRSVDAAQLAAQTGLEPREVSEKLVNSQSWAGDMTKSLRMNAAAIKSLVAWDAVRLVNLARWAVQVGFIGRDEFASYANRLSQRVKDDYSSWAEVGAAYVVAGLVWNYSEAREENLVRTNRMLGDDPRSPYKSVAFR